MPVRHVEWKLPYTGWTAIEIDENKVISLRLRDENNLIIWDAWDNEIYVDLQLNNEIRPTSAFPVGVTTGRVIVDNGWDVSWTLICAKTTSWDNIKILYGDNGKLYIDNGTGTFKQIYLKWEVDALLLALRQYVDWELAKKQDLLTAWDNITIEQVWDDLVISAEDTTYTAWDWITIDSQNDNEISCTVVIKSSTQPDSPDEGQIWYDTTNHKFFGYDGTDWQEFAFVTI